MSKVLKGKCVRDCWNGNLEYINQYGTKIKGKLYVQGEVYDLEDDSPVLHCFVDPETEKYLKDPLPPLRFKAPDEEGQGTIDKLIEQNAQLMEAVKILMGEKHSKGDEVLEKMGLGEKRGPGRPSKNE